MSLTVQVPASSANLGPGFDALGLALRLYTTVTVCPSEVLEVCPLGTLADCTPKGAANAVYQAFVQPFALRGQPVPTVRMEIASEIPLARGLGSSAAALLSGLLAGNALLRDPLGQGELLDLAACQEGHADNVAAALLGGVAVACFGGRNAQVLRLDPGKLGALLVVPEEPLATSVARGVLPDQYSRHDTVHALSHAALLAAALATGKLELLGVAMQDRLHQPYRAKLVPALESLLELAPRWGALGAALSGAGPSVLCLYDRDRGEPRDLEQAISGWMAAVGLRAQLLRVAPDLQGARVIRPGAGAQAGTGGG